MEVDAVEQIHVGVMREGVAIGEIDPALRRAGGDPRRLIGWQRGFRDGLGRSARQDRTPTERRRARIGVNEGAGQRIGRLAPIGDDTEIGAGVADRDPGPEFIDRQALGEVGGERHGTIQEKGWRPAGGAQNEEIEQNLALRGQQRRVARLPRRQADNVVGQHPLQEAGRVLAFDANHAAVGKICGGQAHQKGSQAACQDEAC